MDYTGYEQYIVKNKYKHYRKSKNILKPVFLVLVVGLTGAILILSGKKFATFLGVNRQLICEKTCFYALKYGQFDTLEIANSSSSILKECSGAGFIEKNGEKYDVFIACYPDKERAEKVKNNLIKQNIDCTVEEIIVDSFILKNSENVKSFYPYLNSYVFCFNEIYDTFENYTGYDVVLKQKFTTMYVNLKEENQKFISTVNMNGELLVCQMYINDLIVVLENLMTNENYDYSVQFSLLKMVYNYQKMIFALNKI